MGLLESLDGQPPAGWYGNSMDRFGFLKLVVWLVNGKWIFFFESDMYRTFGYIERCTVNANTC